MRAPPASAACDDWPSRGRVGELCVDAQSSTQLTIRFRRIVYIIRGAVVVGGYELQTGTFNSQASRSPPERYFPLFENGSTTS